MISATHVADREEARQKIKADTDAWIAKYGQPRQIPSGVTGDTFCERMNAQGAKAAKSRARGTKNSPVSNPR